MAYAFYNSVGEAVLWHSADHLAVADWGICDEITFRHLAMGSDLRAIGYRSIMWTGFTTCTAARPSSGDAI
jgi:hypothetical protein